MKWTETLTENRVWRSIVRHGIRATNRNRIMVVMESFILHLHSGKVRRRSLEASSTYFLGAIGLVLFAILTATGLLLMFYYHPSVPRAYDDMKELQFTVSNG